MGKTSVVIKKEPKCSPYPSMSQATDEQEQPGNNQLQLNNNQVPQNNNNANHTKYQRRQATLLRAYLRFIDVLKKENSWQSERILRQSEEISRKDEQIFRLCGLAQQQNARIQDLTDRLAQLEQLHQLHLRRVSIVSTTVSTNIEI